MARRLEKIEKEMGYCEVKLEKERRHRKQIECLDQELHDLEQLIKLLRPHDALLKGRVGTERSERPSREAFLAAGLLDLAADKREWMQRCRAEVSDKLPHFTGFNERLHSLEEEKKATLRGLSSARYGKMLRLTEDFKKTEQFWNELTEDTNNLEEASFYIDRNLDYLRSARNFLIIAKGSYDVETWRQYGYLADLFRHSNIGRAREMVDGADRNIQMAQMDLACVTQVRNKPKESSYVRVLLPFMDALYEDLFGHGRILATVQVVEAALASNLKLEGQLKSLREGRTTKLERAEKNRSQLFHRMGADRSRELTA
jgi:hypothetical protein